MTAGYHYDPEAERRSAMMRRKSLCNGQLTGRQCIYYWTHVEKVESNNPDNLKLGEIYRGCTYAPSIVHEMSEAQLATYCNQYKPRRRTLRVLLGLDADRGAYDPQLEMYDPLTPEQIRALQAESPAAPTNERDTTGMLVDQQVEAFKAEVGVGISASDALAALEENDQGIFGSKE